MPKEVAKTVKKRRPEVRKEKGQAKRERRKKRVEERGRLGEEAVPKQTPRTIENSQEADDTFVHSDDDEVLADLNNDDMANYFGGGEEAEPKILITTSPGAKVKTWKLCFELKRCLPNAEIFSRKNVAMKRVVKRGRCFKLRKFAQTAPDEAGKLTLFFNQMHSPFLDKEGIQRQVVAYLSQKEDIPTFPRFYLNDHFWYRIRLKKRRITMLTPNPHCSPTRHMKKGNCYVDSWLRERVTGPLNCTIFYFSHKNPELDICDPEIIFLHYRSVINVVSNRSAYQNLTKCLPACERDIIDTQLYSKQFQDQRNNAGTKNAYFHLEASYENLQVEIYEEKVTTTLPGFISQIGGQLSFFLGMSSISLLQFFMIPIANFIMTTLSSVRRKFSVKPE